MNDKKRNPAKWILSLVAILVITGVGIRFHEPIRVWFGIEPNEVDNTETVETADTPKAAILSVNKFCPIKEGEVQADVAMVDWKGHKIGFCCPGCDTKWNAWPDAKKLAFVDQSLKASSALAAAPAKAKKPLPPADAIAFWTCAMHPSVKSKIKGDCPICKMGLLPVTHEEVRTGVIFVDAERRQLIGLRTTTAMKQDLTHTVRAVGIVSYDQTRLTDVSLKYRGWIGELFADFMGKKVQAGQPLFTIYSPQLLSAQQEYLDAIESGARAGRDSRLLESAKRRLLLWDLSPGQVDALAERKSAEQYVPYLSPVTGTIVHKMVVKGGAVEPGKMVFRIADLSSVWIEAELYENEIPLIKVGQSVDIDITYLPGKPLQGKVAFVYPYLDPKTRRGRVRIEVPNPEGALRPDMYATLKMRVPMGKRLVIPEEAVLYAGPTNVVFVDLGKDRIRPERVKLGTRIHDPKFGGRWIEVLEGLKAGDSVVSSGNFLIASESKLKSGIARW
jgi:Cu(I)/Ag(I) efflux system membrane fusion protein